MSSVAISGNASGAGVLTIAAPNTASSYTLTLPTQTGTLAAGTNANSVTLPGATSGTATIAAPAVAGSNTATLPASTGNILLDVARSLTNNGYLTLSDGLIIQWGTGSAVANTTTTVTFPITFPTSCLHVMGTPSYGTASNNCMCTLVSNTTSQAVFQVFDYTNGALLVAPKWLAIGY